MIADWDDAYANAPHIPGGDDYPRALGGGGARRSGRRCAGAAARGAALRGAPARSGSTCSCPTGAPQGLVVFVHGGYWRAFDRGTWSHLAAGPLARGWAVAMPGYVLAPEARIAAITAMIAEAVRGRGGRVAGADPAGRAFGRRAPGGAAGLRRQPAAAAVRGAGRRGWSAISGLHDLRPLLRLGAQRRPAARRRPRRRPRARRCSRRAAGARVHAWVGDDERPEFVRQTTLIANIWTGLGAEMAQTIEPGRHHFDVIDGLARPGLGAGRGAGRMRSGHEDQARVVVIGGGVVGCSVLYHLAKAGWTDVMLIERSELTSGSSWHAAGGFHTLNGDPNVAKLQAYTVGLYRELEELSRPVLRAAPDRRRDDGRHARSAWTSCGWRTPRGAASAWRPRSSRRREATAMFPLMDASHFVGALWDPVEGHLDPAGHDARLRQGGAEARARRSCCATASSS